MAESLKQWRVVGENYREMFDNEPKLAELTANNVILSKTKRRGGVNFTDERPLLPNGFYYRNLN
jgi:hypothetical protein